MIIVEDMFKEPTVQTYIKISTFGGDRRQKDRP